MSQTRRRDVVVGGCSLVVGGWMAARSVLAQAGDTDPAQHRRFTAEAERMRREAVAAGDQSYGAVVVMGGEIVGWGPSRVVLDRNPNAHAERVAISDAQARLGRSDLNGTQLYSTSRACPACEAAAAKAGISRAYWGPQASDGGRPRG